MRRWWRREEIQESQGPRVQRSKGPMDPLKVKFKYELDSKEGLVFWQIQQAGWMLKGAGLLSFEIGYMTHSALREADLKVFAMFRP